MNIISYEDNAENALKRDDGTESRAAGNSGAILHYMKWLRNCRYLLWLLIKIQ